MGWGGSLPLHQFASAASLHKMYLPTIYNIHLDINIKKLLNDEWLYITYINKPVMMSSIGKAPHLVSADCIVQCCW